MVCSAHLVLPWDWYRACGELRVEVIVSMVQVDTFHSGELLDVQHIFAVHSPGLKETGDSITWALPVAAKSLPDP